MRSTCDHATCHATWHMKSRTFEQFKILELSARETLQIDFCTLGKLSIYHPNTQLDSTWQRVYCNWVLCFDVTYEINPTIYLLKHQQILTNNDCHLNRKQLTIALKWIFAKMEMYVWTFCPQLLQCFQLSLATISIFDVFSCRMGCAGLMKMNTQINIA